MARAPVLAAGGIVLRQSRPPLIAVRLRKCNDWVLPKGKLDDGETPRDAAMREVWEETGHDVAVHEFLGTLAYDAGGRAKIVHYWRMESSGEPSRDLTDDVRAVDWLPLDAAVERLSRDHERAFLANVGPLALESARRSRDRKPQAADKQLPDKRRRRTHAPKPAISPPMAPSLGDVTAMERITEREIMERDVIERNVDERAPRAELDALDDGGPGSPRMEGSPSDRSDPAVSGAFSPHDQAAGKAPQCSRAGVMQRVLSWLRRG